jgi:hypothetical protein
VTPEKPVGVRCGPDEVVLFRDKAGIVRAFENRCPHRRVPLSLGRMKDGALQCGYHGWTFEGGTGKCISIPNLHDDEKVPERYAVGTYAVEEQDGFVYVWVGAASSARPEALPRLKLDGSGREFTGSVTVVIPYDEFVAALFDGPELLFDFSTVRLTEFVLGDPQMQDQRLVMERGAGWRGLHLPDRFVPEWPLVLRMSVDPTTGQALVEVRNLEEALLFSAVLAVAPAARGATSARWRCRAATEMGGAVAGLTRLLAQAGRSPLAVKPFIDGKALAELRPGPSTIWRAAAETSGDIFAAA